MQIRDRIVELRRVRAAELRPNPRNWRTHPEAQRNVLRGLLAEIGYASALLARQLPDGSLELIDGHLRAETTPEAQVPVLVLDVNETEAGLILSTLDPLSAMAGRDDDLLASLLDQVGSENEAVQQFLSELPGDEPAATESPDDAHAEPELPESWQVLVDCADEAQQQMLYERLTAEGYKCRLMML